MADTGKFNERFGSQNTERVKNAYREFVKALVWESNKTCECWDEDEIEQFLESQADAHLETDCSDMHDAILIRSYLWYEDKHPEV